MNVFIETKGGNYHEFRDCSYVEVDSEFLSVYMQDGSQETLFITEIKHCQLNVN